MSYLAPNLEWTGFASTSDNESERGHSWCGWSPSITINTLSLTGFRWSLEAWLSPQERVRVRNRKTASHEHGHKHKSCTVCMFSLHFHLLIIIITTDQKTTFIYHSHSHTRSTRGGGCWGWLLWSISPASALKSAETWAPCTQTACWSWRRAATCRTASYRRQCRPNVDFKSPKLRGFYYNLRPDAAASVNVSWFRKTSFLNLQHKRSQRLCWNRINICISQRDRTGTFNLFQYKSYV